ncbi:MAG: hypothetical protein P8N50_10365 [Actinomycetota bacterium]|nr:hypothetical protein [Actinomycetota bacterium]
MCTGNICRSPMAEYLMRGRAEQHGLPLSVLSSGLQLEDTPASAHAVTVVGDRGFDMTPHRSRIINEDLVKASDLVLGMTGRHVREAAILDMGDAHMIYTLREFVRRSSMESPRAADESIGEYTKRLHARRSLAQLGSGGPNDDVDDPYGRRKGIYKKTANDLEVLVDEALSALFEGRSFSGG